MAEKKSWDDKFNQLITHKYEVADGKEWRMALEESKNKGTLNLNVRLFQKALKEGGYEGPTKNGFIIQVNSLDEIDSLQKQFNEFFEKSKNIFK